MKTKIYIILSTLIVIPIFAQSGWIGVSTPDPRANLDVNGTVKIRSTPVAPSISGYQILAVNQNAGGDFQVSQMNPQLIADMVISQITPSNEVSSSVYSARKTTGISLIDAGILPNGFRPVNFLTAERTLGTAAIFSDTDNSYVVPSSGTYAVGFFFRYGTGLQAALLSNSPGVAILLNRGGTSTLIDSRTFNGTNLGLVSLTISEANVNSLFSLQAGDRLSFGLTSASVLDLGLIGSSTASFYIYKISN